MPEYQLVEKNKNIAQRNFFDFVSWTQTCTKVNLKFFGLDSLIDQIQSKAKQTDTSDLTKSLDMG